jgi:hypothetical protein
MINFCLIFPIFPGGATEGKKNVNLSLILSDNAIESI